MSEHCSWFLLGLANHESSLLPLDQMNLRFYPGVLAHWLLFRAWSCEHRRNIFHPLHLSWQGNWKIDFIVVNFQQWSVCVLFEVYSWVSRDVINFTGGQLQIDTLSSDWKKFSLYVLTLCLAANMCNMRFACSSAVQSSIHFGLTPTQNYWKRFQWNRRILTCISLFESLLHQAAFDWARIWDWVQHC